MSDDDDITQDDLRILYTGAADVLQEYALSQHFNFERDGEILRKIAQGIEQLMLVMLEKETPNASAQ